MSSPLYRIIKMFVRSMNTRSPRKMYSVIMREVDLCLFLSSIYRFQPCAPILFFLSLAVCIKTIVTIIIFPGHVGRDISVIGISCMLLILSSCASMVRARDPAESQDRSACSSEAYFVRELCPEERRLLEWAAAYPRYRTFSEMTPENLREVAARTDSVDNAAALFYHRAVTEPSNRRFLEYVETAESHPATQRDDYGDRSVLVAFVPGMFYRDVPIRGLKGEPVIEAARELDISAELVPVKQTGTIRENAALIAEFLFRRARDYEEIIVASASKGSADVALMLHENRHAPFVDKIRTWFDIGGILEPSRLVDLVEGRFRLRIRAKVFFGFNGYDYRGFQSMGSTFEGKPGVLTRDLHCPGHIEVVRVVGVPFSDHVTNTSRPFYRLLREHGPNDGLLLHNHNSARHDVLYPSFGNDHYFQWSFPRERVKAFLTYALEERHDETADESNVKQGSQHSVTDGIGARHSLPVRSCFALQSPASCRLPLRGTGLYAAMAYPGLLIRLAPRRRKPRTISASIPAGWGEGDWFLHR